MSESVSSREQEVIDLLLLGHSNKVIAHQLGVSLTTVKARLFRAYRKLDVKNRVALAVLALRAH